MTDSFQFQCAVASCAETKQLLEHCSWCRLESFCPVTHCSFSKSLLHHWDVCKIFHCPLCSSFRKYYGHFKYFVKNTSTTRNYSSDLKKIVRFAPHKASSRSKNVANTLTSTRYSKVNVRNGSHSTFSSKSYKATAPKRVTECQKQHFLSEKYRYKINESAQFDQRITRRCLTQRDESPKSDVKETKWEVPCSSSDWNKDLDHILQNGSHRENIHQESSAELALKSKLY